MCLCLCVCPPFPYSHATCQPHESEKGRANIRCHIWKMDNVQAMNLRILSQVPITMVWPVADINGLLVPGLCITRGSDGVSLMREREWGHRWLLPAWGNLSANFWPELNTNIQTQHAAAAGENTEHCPALMQHFKTISKTSGAGSVWPCGGVGKTENNVKNNPHSSTVVPRRRRDYLRRDWTRVCIFPGVKWKWIWSHVWGRKRATMCLKTYRLSVCLSDPYIGPQRWQTYSPWHCRNHLFNALLMLHPAAHIKHEFAGISLHVNVNPRLIYSNKIYA